MSEKEHPARVAGRYVRAAGLAIQRELERASSEKSERPEQPPPPVERDAADAQEKKAARRSGPKPLVPKPAFDRAVWACFLISMLALVLSGLQIQMLFSGTGVAVARLVLGAMLLVGALLILTNWGRANERIVARLLERVWGIEPSDGRSGRFVRGLVRNGMVLLGIILLTAAAYQILSAFFR